MVLRRSPGMAVGVIWAGEARLMVEAGAQLEWLAADRAAAGVMDGYGIDGDKQRDCKLAQCRCIYQPPSMCGRRRRSADKRRVGAAIDRRATMIGGTNKAAERKGQDRTQRWRRR